jgi:hypothetical protein
MAFVNCNGLPTSHRCATTISGIWIGDLIREAIGNFEAIVAIARSHETLIDDLVSGDPPIKELHVLFSHIVSSVYQE